MKKSKNYDRAIILIQNQVQLFWLVFSAFLITETVILSSIVTLIKDEKNILIFFGSIFGLLICVAWWRSFQYNHAFYLLRIEEAKKLEKKNGFYKQGDELIKERCIKIGKKPITIPWHGGSPKKGLELLIFLFAFSFLALVVLNNPFFNLFWNFCFICNPTSA
ncbi:hypothetical protein [Algoriphagus terrigena]|uniref:RipA family octameric membrane protein n=1 Tax=Algoriphagus terrigena TaxID=344884 RepID=UPI00047DA8AC|nr:hypothetical protein [Algoriphagus terrigena]